jgi:hypothetical protein
MELNLGEDFRKVGIGGVGLLLTKQQLPKTLVPIYKSTQIGLISRQKMVGFLSLFVSKPCLCRISISIVP